MLVLGHTEFLKGAGQRKRKKVSILWKEWVGIKKFQVQEKKERGEREEK